MLSTTLNPLLLCLSLRHYAEVGVLGVVRRGDADALRVVPRDEQRRDPHRAQPPAVRGRAGLPADRLRVQCLGGDRRCKLDPGLKAHTVSSLDTRKDISAFNLNPGFLSLCHYTSGMLTEKCKAGGGTVVQA